MAARLRLIFCSALLALLAPAVFSACERVPTYTAPGVKTATITPELEQVFAVDTPIDVELVARGTVENVFIRVEYSVTASTSSAARDAAELVEIVQVGDDDTIGIVVKPPLGAMRFSGIVRVELPDKLAAAIQSQAGAARVDGVTRELFVNAANSVVIEGAADSTTVRSAGPVSVESRLLSGSTVDVESRGSVELRLPDPLSAEVLLSVGQTGAIQIQHPDLRQPNPLEMTEYRAVSRGGNARVQVLTGGSVAVRAR